MQHTGILCAKKLGVGLQLVARDVGGGLPPSAAARPPRHAAALAATGAGVPPRSPLSGDGAAMEAKQLQAAAESGGGAALPPAKEFH